MALDMVYHSCTCELTRNSVGALAMEIIKW